MTLVTSSNVWPPWSNPPSILFHGTTVISAQNIAKNGVNLTFSQENTDFGRGFYTTTWRQSAEIMAQRKAYRTGGMPAVIKFSLSRSALGELRTIAFVRGSVDASDFWSFVFSCRTGIPLASALASAASSGYDVAYGPVARYWFGPAKSKVYEGYDQISFHTNTAIQALNSKELCSLELL